MKSRLPAASGTGPVYLDYAATTPVDPAVADAMRSCLGPDGDFGNASSATHVFGQRAAARIDAAGAQVAALLNCAPREILFTSGATESNNLAILGVARANASRGRHVVTSRIEHKAVLDPCKRLEKEGFTVTYLTPERSGRIDAGAVREALRPDTVLVSIMLANNETGVLQDVAVIGELCRERGIAFHSDAAQAVGKVPVDLRTLPVDFVSFTAHKLYGPKGAGALYVRESARHALQPILFGGGQQRGLRPGTLATHQIVGLGKACELAGSLQREESVRLGALRERLWTGISPLGGVYLNGAGAPHLAGILNVSFEGVEGESLVAGMAELAVSTGSACNSATEEPSYVLRALGRDSQLAQSSIRFSLGRFTSAADVEVAVRAVSREVRRLRALSPAGGEPVADLSGAAAPYPPGSGDIVVGEAGKAGEEAWVRFHLLVCAGVVKDARFQAYGCPHTLTTVAWLASRLPGRTREDLVPGAPTEWVAMLGIPVEKLGRLLVVEDALRACLRHWTGTDPA
ncbi:MAG TPA: aminotransferase class V-fold PLP-dependent enzyme [Steroidobacteraceae bacterium]|nr:aminotransferase class V-fold PLP-dependent enzyme [Steroidobacteraceae bacterium]